MVIGGASQDANVKVHAVAERLIGSTTPAGRRLAKGKHGQPLLKASPQPVYRVPAHQASQPGASLPAGRQDHLVIVAGAGLGAYRFQHVAVADDAAGLAADPVQLLHGPVHTVFRGGTDVPVGPRRPGQHWNHGAYGYPRSKQELHR